jgi:hypothetical protein
MQRQNILRTLLFVVFFSIGAAALSVSVLCDDLVRYYTDRQLLKADGTSLNRLESLNADYYAVLEQVKKDPNLIKRIAPATLGTEPDDEETIYPKATAEQLDAARKVLTEDSDRQVNESMTPAWLARCSEPLQRVVLFLSGGFLILVSFVCFAPAKESNQAE